ncbi:hypothetical protein LAZ67_X001914 [Cordylochernes scorpioides]|uniref:Transposase n=1 Tax=Cordylochernes scorpioides TaxID=51811 RepID=A0ABY6LT63_9ARAC|nr:hypothetical protein LAZ67_X001914 [Cordylochernes scorpioides]
MFSEGREDVNDEERAGRPSTSTTDKKINEVEKMILANRRITVREVAEDLNISIGSCHSIFINDLGMRRVAAKFVPKLLNCDQKQHRMNIANEMLDSVRDDPNLLQRVITGHEASWGLPGQFSKQTPRPNRFGKKAMLCIWWDQTGVVYFELLKPGKMVNTSRYEQQMHSLREALNEKRPEWREKHNNLILQHDNAPAHNTTVVKNTIKDLGWEL